MKPQAFTVSSKSDLENIFALISDFLDQFGQVSVEITRAEKTRTQTQNRCLHLFCDELATALNDAGLDMRKVMKPEAELPWTKESVKEFLWKPIQAVMYHKQSTTEPTTIEFSEVYRVLDRHLASKFGVSVRWPTRFE